MSLVLHPSAFLGLLPPEDSMLGDQWSAEDLCCSQLAVYPDDAQSTMVTWHGIAAWTVMHT